MTDTTDVLKEWAQQICWADQIPRNRDQQCILALSAAVRALQMRVAKLETWLPKDDEDSWYCPKCHTPSSTDDEECGRGYEREGVS